MRAKNDFDKPRVRFAPAPTGELHVGGARTALFNWLFARKYGGTLVLRIEDTDIERSSDEMTRVILDGLKWLGLDWDEGPEVGGDYGPYFQSQRADLHAEHIQRLLDEGKAFRCYCTPEELEAKRHAAIAAKASTVYDGECRDLSEEQRRRLESEGRKPSVRFRVEGQGSETVDDMIRGASTFDLSTIGDFIIQRSGGGASFHLANVVDDALMGITHVIRGDDHLTNTPRHQLLFRALGYKTPKYAHVPMILAADRSKLSKRHGAVSAASFRDEGYLSEAMVNHMALLGWSPSDDREIFTLSELIEAFSIERIGKSASVFDYAKLNHMNAVRIRAAAPEEIAQWVRPFYQPPEWVGEQQWLILVDLLRESLERLTDIESACRAILDEPNYNNEELKDEAATGPHASVAAKAMSEALGSLEQFDRPSIIGAFKAASKSSGVKGKNLYFSIRAALSGTLHGRDLDGIMAVLGKAECLKRLASFADRFK